MTVKYDTLEDFHAGIVAFVKEGLTFEADAGTLIVALTGGY